MSCPTGYNTISTSLGDICLPSSVNPTNQTQVMNYLGYSTSGVASSSNSNLWQDFLSAGSPFTEIGQTQPNNSGIIIIVVLILLVIGIGIVLTKLHK